MIAVLCIFLLFDAPANCCVVCSVVEYSFECVTEPSDSIHSGAVTVTVSGQYSVESEDHFTFKVSFLLLLSTAVFLRDRIPLIVSFAVFYSVVLFVLKVCRRLLISLKFNYSCAGTLKLK